MAFERFVKTHRVCTPLVSVWRRGQFGFNVALMKIVNNFNYVVLFYDWDARKVGFKLTNEKNEEGAIKIIKGQTSSFIAAKPFIVHYQIPPDTRFLATTISDKNDFIVIDLNYPIN